MDQHLLPGYLVEALQRFRAETHADAQAELQALRAQMAKLLGFPTQDRGDTTIPPDDYAEAEDRPTYAYGAIGNVVKQIMAAAPRSGLLINDICSRAHHDMGMDISQKQAREALKRMKRSGEVECRNRSRWVAMDKLRGANDANENGALNGSSVSAPSNGGGRTLHQSGQPSLGLTGSNPPRGGQSPHW